MADEPSDQKRRGGRHTRKHNFRMENTSHYDYGRGITMESLHDWYKTMFEKLGWMILAKHRKYTDKIAAYKNGIKRLKYELEQKIDQVENQDNKTDLKIMHHNVCLLMEHANKDFK